MVSLNLPLIQPPKEGNGICVCVTMSSHSSEFFVQCVGTCRLYDAIPSSCLVEKGAIIRRMGILLCMITKLSTKMSDLFFENLTTYSEANKQLLYTYSLNPGFLLG